MSPDLFRITESVAGTSVEGRPIALLQLGNTGSVVLIIAGIHGDEPNACKLIDRFIAKLKSDPRKISGTVVIMPRVNPDGCAHQVRRNAQGVDINRNFPSKNWTVGPHNQFYGGPSPLSEPESVAIHKVIEELKPVKIISIHSIWQGGQCNNYDGPGEAMAAAMSAQNHFAVKPSIGYPTPGSLGNWAGNDKQIPMITLELPPRATSETMWEENCEALLAGIK